MYGMMIGNRYYSDAGTSYTVRRLCEEFSAMNVDIAVADMFDAFHGSVLPDFAVFLDKDWVGARLLEKRGVRVFDTSDAIRICDDKYLTYVELDGEVDHPETVCAPLKYAGTGFYDTPLFAKAASLGFPLVAKFTVGSLGSGVFLLNDRDELERFHEENKDKGRLMYQKCIKGSLGRDIRIYTVGGKAIACVKRINEKSFKSNAETGAITERIEPSKEFIAEAEKISGLLKLDYAAVDFFDTREPILNEVNSNAYFKEAEKASGVDIAGTYARYIAEEVRCAKRPKG